MHFILRTLILFLRKRWLTPVSPDATTSFSMMVLPTDLDLLMHVNNGVYFSYMDFGRWNMIFKSGVYDMSRKMGWYSVVAGETIRFRKSLKLWDRFTMETKILGYDEKYFFIRQRFIRQGEIYATGLVKVRFLKNSGGTVAVKEVLDALKFHHFQNDAQELSLEWADMESRFLVS